MALKSHKQIMLYLKSIGKADTIILHLSSLIIHQKDFFDKLRRAVCTARQLVDKRKKDIFKR